ncbi:MAG: 5-formyltetrahydrofolate cyclo-ligase [Pseudomonadota bacterium]
MVDTDKATLRRRFRAARRSLIPAQRRSHSAAIARHFASSSLALLRGTTAAYLANGWEVDPQPLVQRLHRRGQTVALPAVVGRASDQTLAFFETTAATPLQPGAFGLLEPGPNARHVPAIRIRLLLMPLVAFDATGRRLGQGGGFYDRFLARFNRPSHPVAHLLPLGPLRIGLAFECQFSEQPLPSEAHDQPLDGVLTECGFRVFSTLARRHGESSRQFADNR